MGYQTTTEKMNAIFSDLSKDYLIYGPKRFVGDGTFTHVDTIRYGQITNLSEIEFAEKSNYSFKEVLLPISETLFYFTKMFLFRLSFHSRLLLHKFSCIFVLCIP